MAKPFEERLATALQTDRSNVETLRQLIAETRAELECQQALHVKAAEESVDVTLNATDRDEAAVAADRAKRLAAGYADALQTLNGKLEAKLTSERGQREREEKAAALAERDALTDEIREKLPDAIATITNLLGRVEANAAWMRAVGLHERDAEAEARNVPGNFFRNGVPIDRFVQMRIPNWDGPGRAWPMDVSAGTFRRLEEHERKRRGAELKRNSSEALAAAADDLAREEAKWARYRVGHTRNALISDVLHRRGSSTLDCNETQILEMTEEQVAAARTKGLKVDPVEEERRLKSQEAFTQPAPRDRLTIPWTSR